MSSDYIKRLSQNNVVLNTNVKSQLLPVWLVPYLATANNFCPALDSPFPHSGLIFLMQWISPWNGCYTIFPKNFQFSIFSHFYFSILCFFLIFFFTNLSSTVFFFFFPLLTHIFTNLLCFFLILLLHSLSGFQIFSQFISTWFFLILSHFFSYEATV